MLRRFRFALRPRWILFHIFIVAVSVTMVLLGHWQLTVSDRKGFDLQNFGYALQWWVFTGFALFLWGRVMRDTARRNGNPRAYPSTAEAQAIARAAEATEQVAYRRYVPPQLSARSDDYVHSAYNDYLANLAAEDSSTDKEQR